MPVHRTDAVPAEARRGQAGVIDSCELSMGVRNGAQLLWKSSKCSNH